MGGAFDPNVYYRFFNNYDVNKTMSIKKGVGEQESTLMMITAGSNSKENWQIYYQGGRYFFRNYEYGGSMQLGLNKDSQNPALIARDGSLEQQWTLATTPDKKWYTVTNGLLGNESYLALTGDYTWPVMQHSTEGALWTIEINRSAGMVNAYMTEGFPNLETPTKSFTSPVPNPTQFNTTLPSSSLPSFVTGPTQSNIAHLPPASSLKAGTVAGIVATGATVSILLLILIWFLWKRRKDKRAMRTKKLPLADVNSGTKMMAFGYEMDNQGEYHEMNAGSRPSQL